MNSDTLKLIFTYALAFVVVVGGGLMLYATRSEPAAQDLRLALAGFIGAALTYVFNRETATQATRAAQSSAAGGTPNAG